MPNKKPKANKVTISGLEDQLTPIVLAGSDPDGLITGYTLTSLPSGGTLYVDAALQEEALVNVTYGSSTFYFHPNADLSGTISFNYRVQDNQNAISPTAGVTIRIAGVNDAPVLDLTGADSSSSATLNYVSVGSAVPIAPSAAVSDIDSVNFGGGTLRVSITQNGTTADQLSVTTDTIVSIANGSVFVNGTKVGTISSLDNGSNGSDLLINLVNGAAPAAVSILLEHIAYSNSSANPSTPPRTLTFTLNDGDGTANGGQNIGTATATIIFSPAIKLTEPFAGTAGYSLWQWRPDGTALALESFSTLTPDDTDGGAGANDVYAIDLGTGDRTLLTASIAAGIEGDSYVVGWSPDGAKVIVRSTSTLTPDDTDGSSTFYDLYAIDLGTGDKTLLTGSVTGGVELYSWFSSFSPDGTTVIVLSYSTLTPDDTDGGKSDLYAIDLGTGDKTLLTGSVAGGVEGEASSFAGWAPDGTTMIVQSSSALTPDDMDGLRYDLYAIDFTTGNKTLLTASVAGGTEGHSYFAGWSPDEATAIFGSSAALTPDDTDGSTFNDLYAVDWVSGDKTLLTASVAGGAEGHSYVAGWSPDGATVLVGSISTLTSDDTDGGSQAWDLYAIDFTTGNKTLLTASVAGGFEGGSTFSGWSPDGTTIVVSSNANLTSDDTDGEGEFGSDLYAIDLTTGDKTLLTAPVTGGNEGHSSFIGWSPDGTTVIVQSTSALTSDDASGAHDLFAVNVATGDKILLGSDSQPIRDASTSLLRWNDDGQSIDLVTKSSFTPDDLDGGGIDIYTVNVTTGEKSLIDLALDSAIDAWGVYNSEVAVIALATAETLDYYLFI
jgi:hypothetical protein